jgi:hypothetical protein
MRQTSNWFDVYDAGDPHIIVRGNPTALGQCGTRYRVPGNCKEIFSADLLAWLRHVTCTASGGAGDLATIPAVAQLFPLLLVPAAISNYVAAIVLSNLPGRLWPQMTIAVHAESQMAPWTRIARRPS